MRGRRYSFGPFLLNCENGTLLRHGEPLPVGGRGAGLLEALLRHPGDVVTKAELMDAAWPDTAVEESNLSVQIAAIRKLLGPSPDGGEWIATIPRIGYRFIGRLDAAPAAATLNTPLATPKPSLAILPFASIGKEPEQQFFADGLAEDVITALSKLSGILVIARNSSFVYRDRSVDVRQIAKELAVQYVLEGSVRKSPNRIRVTAQLSDTESGIQIWAESYDRGFSDLFAVQDDVTMQIVRALNVKLGSTEAALLAESGTSNVEALVCFRSAMAMVRADFSPEIRERSEALFRRAIDIDPSYAEPYASLAMNQVAAYSNSWTDNPQRALADAESLVEQALRIDPNNSSAHFVSGQIAAYRKDLDRWASEIDRHLSLNPNSATGHWALGQFRIYSGEPLAAIAPLERAMRLDPSGAHQYLHALGLAHLVAGNYETAAARLQDRIRLMPGTDWSRAFLSAALGHLGRVEEARRIWTEIRTVNPNYSFTEHIGLLPFKDPAGVRQIISGLDKAGLPD